MPSQGYLVTPKPAPPLNIPSSASTATVSVIDTGARFKLPIDLFFEPSIPGKDDLTGPAYSFLITSSTGRRILFDLSIRKDIENLAPRIVKRIKEGGWDVQAPQDVAGVLKNGGVPLDSIEAIVWSHWHWDHTGDPSTFPSTTDLVVGPGFKSAFTPGYPTNPDAPNKDADWANRTLREIDFSTTGLKIGRFAALDFFGDGSFYLLNTPGHAIGHMCGLARVATQPDAFVFMGGDCCHHPGEFRPTAYLPLPKEISPSPLPGRSVCPGSLFQELQREKRADRPFYSVKASFPHDLEDCEWSIEGCEEVDADRDVLVVMAHDESLLDLLEFFPKGLGDWKEKDLAEKGRWRFLGDFKGGIEGGKGA